jgi:hypothetical protein
LLRGEQAVKKPTGPILDIATSDGTLVPFAFEFLQAVMAYPDDPDARKDLLETSLAWLRIGDLYEAAKKNDPARSKAHYAALKKWWLKQATPFYQQAAHRGAWVGSIAGDILLYCVQIDRWAPPASLQKAIDIVEVYLRDAHGADGKAHGPKREREIKNVWLRYRSVAHLWAAQRLAQFHEGNTSPWEIAPHLNFILSDESVRNFWLSLKTYGASGPPYGIEDNASLF